MAAVATFEVSGPPRDLHTEAMPAVPTPPHSLEPHSLDPHAFDPQAVDRSLHGWVPDTVPIVAGPDQEEHPGGRPAERPTLTALLTPPRSGGVRRPRTLGGAAAPSASALWSCR